MSRLRCFVFGAVASVLSAAAAEPTRPFSETLGEGQKQRLGLAALSPAQLAELDAAVDAYTRSTSVIAMQQVVRESDEKVQQAEKKAAMAAETAVADYKQKKEPGVIARTLDAFKTKQEDDKREHMMGRVVGAFHGWSGGTYFPLENGQVWRQVGSEWDEKLPAVSIAEVEIFRSGSGYWRLKYAGAWITVKRLQ